VKKNVAHLLVNGDFFDVHDPSPQLISRVQDMLEWAIGHGTQVHLLLGNHDMHSTSAADNALAPLRKYAKVYDEPRMFVIPGAIEVMMVPFQVGPASRWVQESMDFLNNHNPKIPRIMCVHAGIRDPKTAAYLAGAADCVDVTELRQWCKATFVSHVFAGNWHDSKRWIDPGEPSVIQCGALCPTGWDNPGLSYGRMYIYDTTSLTGTVEEVVIPGPRFIQVSDVDEAERFAEIAKKKNLKMFVRLVEDANVLAESGVPDRPDGLAGWEVVANAAATKAATADAAKAAKSKETLDEALVAFINTMPLAEGVSPGEVLTLSKEILSLVRKEADV